jgi:hypothetical protein
MVVHCKRAPYDVYIGRGGDSIWGNPFEIGKHGSRTEVIASYEGWLRTGNSYGVANATEERRKAILDNLALLKGKTLGCWCAPAACHGDVLLKMLSDQVATPENEKAAQEHLSDGRP